MKGAQDKMARFGRPEGELGSVFISDFSDHYDIGVLAQGSPQSGGEPFGIGVEFPLGKKRAVVFEEIFDGVLEGDDVVVPALIEFIKGGGEGGGLSRTGGAGDENET